MIKCKTKFDGGAKIRAAVKNATLEQLGKSSKFLMKVARQKIKYRRRKTSSPGAPPFQHTKGISSFSHSITFAIDKNSMTAYVGPQKVSGKAGTDVPRTLEFGGITRPAADPTWYQVDNVPKGLDSVSAIASWQLRQKVGPLFMAGSESGLVNQVHEGGRVSRKQLAAEKKQNASKWMFRHILKRKIQKKDGSKKTVYYYLMPISSPAQARKAAQNIVDFYGMPAVKERYVKPRPFMGPTLDDSKNSLAHFFAGSFE